MPEQLIASINLASGSIGRSTPAEQLAAISSAPNGKSESSSGNLLPLRVGIKDQDPDSIAPVLNQLVLNLGRDLNLIVDLDGAYQSRSNWHVICKYQAVVAIRIEN